MAAIAIPWLDDPSISAYQPEEKPSIFNTIGAAFRQENSLVSAAANDFRGLDRLIDFDPNYNPYTNLSNDPKYQQFLDRFLWAKNDEDVEFIKLSIDQELQDRNTIARAGRFGFVSSMTAGILDPINLIPIGGALKGISDLPFWGRVLSGAGRGAMGGAIGAAAQEIPLYFTQYTRTPEEGIVSVGAGAMLGAILGGAVGAIPLKDRIKMQADIADDLLPISKPTGKIFLGGFGGEESSIQALERAFNESAIDQGAYRMARTAITENPSFDANSSLEIVDAVRFAQDEELRSQGWTQDQIDQINANPETRPRILGETYTRQEGDILHTAIRLYRGHDADTVIEEWYHRFFDRMSDEDRLIFEEYHSKTGDQRPINEHFAQEGRDYFFSEGGHEGAGGIKSLFQKAKDTLRALIDRIRKIRGASLPDKITELYRKAGGGEVEESLAAGVENKSFQIREPLTQNYVYVDKNEEGKWAFFFNGRQYSVNYTNKREALSKGKIFSENQGVLFYETKPIIDPAIEIQAITDRIDTETTSHHTNKVFIHHVFQEYRKNHPEITREEFNQLLLKLNREHKIDLGRIDMPVSYGRRNWDDPDLIESAVDDGLGRPDQTEFFRIIKKSGYYNKSFQIREVYKTLADLPEGVDPNSVRRPEIIPERLWKSLARVHPGLSAYTMKHLRKPAEIFNNLLEGSERHWKNWAGIATDEAVETKIKRDLNKYSVRHDSIFWDNYWALQKRLTGEEQKLQGTQRGKVQQRLLQYRKLDQYKREVYEALQELHGGKSITKANLSSKFEPEVVKAAQEIGQLYNDLGKRLAQHGLLPAHLIEALQSGYVHIPRIWKSALVRKYRAALVKILKAEERGDELPFLTSPEELAKIADSNAAEEAIDNILASPTGYLGIQINSADPTDIGTAHFLEKRSIDIDSEKLFVEVDGKRIDLVETDPEIIFKNYLDSVMPDIILSEHFSQGGKVTGQTAITLKPAFDAIVEEANAKIKALGDEKGKAYDEILDERDKAIKSLKAMRDVLRNDYHPNGRPDMSTFAARAPGLILTVNAMQGLGGVVTSSLGDIVTSIAHVGLGPYAKGISDFMKMQGTELFSKWKKEVTHVWGVAGEMATGARYGAFTDITDTASGATAPERWVNFWGRQMGLVTGIDWWNSKMKLMTAFIVQHATLDAANKLAKAVDSGKIKSLNIEAAGKILKKDDLVDLASMGLGIDDLVAVSREVRANGEINDGLILPRTSQWTDRALASRFESAMAKKVDAIIVTPGAGDKPLWMRYGIGKFVSQFKSYPMAAMRKILFRGLQNPDQKLAVGTLASTMMGGLIYTLKSLERGEAPKWDNPAQFLYESIDRAGLFGYLTDANNYIEKLTYNRVGIAPLLQPLVGLESASRGRWQESLIDLAFGPTGDTIEGYHKLITSTIPHTLAIPFGGGPTAGDINQAFKLVWFSRLSGVRSAMEWLRNQAIDNLAVQPNKTRSENLMNLGD